MAQQTALEEFWEQIADILPFSVDSETAIKLYERYQEAKLIERKQHESTCVNVIERIMDKLEKGEYINSEDIFNQYYNETYEKE